jgi:hypothetical protein
MQVIFLGFIWISLQPTRALVELAASEGLGSYFGNGTGESERVWR